MSMYGFEYFCGANVVLYAEGMPLIEAAGLQYQVDDSKMPIYGYSSRHYDAVAAGQVIVRGTLLINYVHQDYLFKAVQRGLGQTAPRQQTSPIVSGGDEADLTALAGDYDEAVAFIENMKAQYWASANLSDPNRYLNLTRNPHDFQGGIDITAAFGAQSAMKPSGKTGLLLRDVHFTGRSSVIKIDEEVIVEAYPFFARDVFSTRNPYKEGTVVAVDDEVTVTTILQSN